MIRSFAPKARAGTKYGAAKRVDAAAEVWRKERRESMENLRTWESKFAGNVYKLSTPC
jgi:hypothetical protein